MTTKHEALRHEVALLRGALEALRADMIQIHGAYWAHACEITDPEHPYYDSLREVNRALGRPEGDVS